MTAAQVEQRRQNAKRIAERRRTATHCQRNHELTPANTYVRPDNGRRECLTCKRDRRWYETHGLGGAR